MAYKKEFYVFTVYDRHHIPCIIISYELSERLTGDEPIAELIELPIQDYEKLLYKYGAHFEEDIGLVFTYRSDAQALVDYLNKTYLIMLKLSGKI